jgi:hypothetical protein
MRVDEYEDDVAGNICSCPCLEEKDATHREGRLLKQRIAKLQAAEDKKASKLYGNMFSKLGGLYAQKAEAEDFSAAKASGDGETGPIDIGHGFSAEVGRSRLNPC